MQLLKPKQVITTAIALATIAMGMFIIEGNADAKSIQPNDISTQSYVVGKHLFTREANPDAGYEGYIDTRMIMLAAKTIQGDTLDDMNIYYKKTDGSWVDGLTSKAIVDMPESFDIEYKNTGRYASFEVTCGHSIWKEYEQYVSDCGIRVDSMDVEDVGLGVDYLIPATEIEDWVTEHNKYMLALGFEPDSCQTVVNETRYCDAPSLGAGPGTINIALPIGEREEYHVFARFWFYDMVAEEKNYVFDEAIEINAPSGCNSAAQNIDEAVCMQDMNDAVASTMVLERDYRLVDMRDGQSYTIGKLADGKVWMRQNLALGNPVLGSYRELTLDPNDSDISSSFILPAPQTTGSNSWFCESDTACQNARVFATQTSTYGNYYSWYTATANSGTYSMDEGDMAAYSICPKGWKLPTGGETGDLKNLYSAYNSSFEDFVNATSFSFSGTYGTIYDESGYDQGNSGVWWSRSAGAHVGAYYLSGSNSGHAILPNFSDADRSLGNSVRCVAR